MTPGITEDGYLTDSWYLAAASSELKAGRQHRIMVLGEPVVVGEVARRDRALGVEADRDTGGSSPARGSDERGLGVMWRRDEARAELLRVLHITQQVGLLRLECHARVHLGWLAHISGALVDAEAIYA